MSVESMFEPAWYALLSKRNAFHIAEKNLARRGIAVFAPKSERVTERFGRKITMQTLFFPGYLFIYACPYQPKWRTISFTPGVSRVVAGPAGQPARIPEDFIAELQTRFEPDGKRKPPVNLKPGDIVSVTSGPFAGLISEIERVDEQKRVWILLEILGGTRSIPLSQDALLRA